MSITASSNTMANPGAGDGADILLIKQGAEAKLYATTYLGKPTIIKERFSKAYRHPTLDKSLTSQRTKSEVRSMVRCRMNGIQTPALYLVDLESSKIYMEHFKDSVTVKDYIRDAQKQGNHVKSLIPLAKKMGNIIGRMHGKNIIHGDLTTSNMLLRTPVSMENMDMVMIDFGLGYLESLSEDKGVDLYVLERALLSTHPNTEELFAAVLESYKQAYGNKTAVKEVLAKFEEVRMRGRKRTMVG